MIEVLCGVTPQGTFFIRTRQSERCGPASRCSGRTPRLRLNPITHVMFSNRAETRPNHEKPALRDRLYPTDAVGVMEATRKAVRNLTRWRFISFDAESCVIHLEHDTPVITFTDDVRLHLTEKNGATIVQGASGSRVGEWDFGVNERNLREILFELDRLLGGERDSLSKM